MAITLDGARAAIAEYAEASRAAETANAEGGDCGPEQQAEINRLTSEADNAWDRMAAAWRATAPGREAEVE